MTTSKYHTFDHSKALFEVLNQVSSSDFSTHYIDHDWDFDHFNRYQAQLTFGLYKRHPLRDREGFRSGMVVDVILIINEEDERYVSYDEDLVFPNRPDYLMPIYNVEKINADLASGELKYEIFDSHDIAYEIAANCLIEMRQRIPLYIAMKAVSQNSINQTPHRSKK